MNETKKRRATARTAMPVVPRRGAVSIPDRLKKLDRTQRHAVLATFSAAGPHASLVAFVLTKDGKGIVFATPKATVKYRNMRRDARMSLLIDSRTNTSKDYRGAEAMTIYGRVKEVPDGIQWAELATLLVSKHPELAQFVAAETSALMLVTIRRCVHVGKFQEVTEGGV